MAQIVELGDHYVVIGEMIYTNVPKQPEGRADEAILEMKELGDNVFYIGSFYYHLKTMQYCYVVFKALHNERACTLFSARTPKGSIVSL